MILLYFSKIGRPQQLAGQTFNINMSPKTTWIEASIFFTIMPHYLINKHLCINLGEISDLGRPDIKSPTVLQIKANNQSSLC